MTVTILSPRRTVYDGEASSVFLPGDLAEFEILDYHAPIVSLLRTGHVVIDGTTRIPVNRGLVQFDQNACTILVEEDGEDVADG